MKTPDRVLIGGEDQKAINSLKNIYSTWVNEEKIITTNLWSSELSKLTANAFLAQRISSINSISALCEVTGANIEEVKNAVGLDSRIGSKFLNVGPGFGGSCFQKDILNLTYLCEHFGIPEVSAYWNQVITLNEWQKHRIYKLVINKLFGNVNKKKIAIFGFAFKSNTNDTRESPAISICRNLLDEGAFLAIHDPQVSYIQISNDLGDIGKVYSDNWVVSDDLEKSYANANSVIILTEWEIYKNLDWMEVDKKLIAPAWVFDTRKIVDSISVKDCDFNFWQVGMSNFS